MKINFNEIQLIFIGVMVGLVVVTRLVLRFTKLRDYLPTDPYSGKGRPW